MILSKPTKITNSGNIEIGADLSFSTQTINLPPRLWYRFPEKYENRLSMRSDAFAATALLIAMYTGENLHIHGKLSPLLAYNLEEYKIIFCTWYPDIFKPIKITHEELVSPPQPSGRRSVATAFSGGVDSFYTTWTHLARNQPLPDAQLTHGLFVHGLDQRLNIDEDNYQIGTKIYKDLFQELGLELIEAATNAYHFAELRINWAVFFGAPTIGAALVLTPWLSRFYMPSGMSSYKNLFPNGSSPVIDHLLSTEGTEIVHHGASLSRIQKVKELAQWPTTYGKLRVCSNRNVVTETKNCSACHKCYRTMITLDLLGELQHHRNFSHKLRGCDYIRWGTLTHMDTLLAGQLRNRALKQRWLYQAIWIQTAIILRYLSKLLIKMVTKILKRDQLYMLKRLLFRSEYSSTERKNDHPRT